MHDFEFVLILPLAIHFFRNYDPRIEGNQGAYMDIKASDYCIDFSSDIENNGSILAFSNSAGGGHIEAANALYRQYLYQQKALSATIGSFRIIDIFRDSFPPLLNNLFAYCMTYHWNRAKRLGDIEAQENLVNGKVFGFTKAFLADLFLFVPVALSTLLRLYFNRRYTHIVITQPLAINAIIKAARAVNCLSGRKIRISLVLTDLPTAGATHYSRPVKKLSEKDKKLIRVIATSPLKFNRDESDKEWWHSVFGLHFTDSAHEACQVFHRELPLRPAFLRWKDVPRERRAKELNVKINSEEEFHCIASLQMEGLINRKNLPPSDREAAKEVLAISIDDKRDIVALITIGSQAACKSREYVEDFIAVAKELPKERNYFCFVACGRHTPGQKTLFRTVYDSHIHSRLPGNVHIIPMGYQDDDEFAPLMHRMDFGVTSAGGLTSFELLRTAKGRIFLHSEADPGKLTLPLKEGEVNPFISVVKDPAILKLLEGFSLWEKWNSLYGILDKQASVVIPGELFRKAMQKTVEESSPAQLLREELFDEEGGEGDKFPFS